MARIGKTPQWPANYEEYLVAIVNTLDKIVIYRVMAPDIDSACNWALEDIREYKYATCVKYSNLRVFSVSYQHENR